MKSLYISDDNFEAVQLDDGIEYHLLSLPLVGNNITLRCRNDVDHIYIGKVQATPFEAIAYQLLFLDPTAGKVSAVYYKFTYEALIGYKSPIDRHKYIPPAQF